MVKIISLLIMIFLLFSCACTSYEKELSDILGIKDVKSKLLQRDSDWHFSFEKYKLSENNISDFISKSKKILPNKPNLNKKDWSRIPLDSIQINVQNLIQAWTQKFSEPFEAIESLLQNGSYYALYYDDNSEYILIYIIDEKNKLIYIKSTWI